MPRVEFCTGGRAGLQRGTRTVWPLVTSEIVHMHIISKRLSFYKLTHSSLHSPREYPQQEGRGVVHVLSLGGVYKACLRDQAGAYGSKSTSNMTLSTPCLATEVI